MPWQWPWSWRWTPLEGRDEAELLSILRQHGMIAVNAYHDKQRFTYSHAGVKSQLDYVFAKGCQATGLSKKARGLHDFPLLAARGEGSHVLIFAQLPRHWRIWRYGAGQACGPSAEATKQYLQQNQNTLVTQVQQALQLLLTSVAQIDHVLKEAQQVVTVEMPNTGSSSVRPCGRMVIYVMCCEELGGTFDRPAPVEPKPLGHFLVRGGMLLNSFD